MLLGGWLDVGVLIAGIVLATLSRVEKDLSSLLDTLEEAVIFVALAGSGLLVGMVAEDLLAVGALDLFGGSLVAVLAEAEDGVVILALFLSGYVYLSRGLGTNLPVLSIALEHHGILRLGDLIILIFVDFLNILLSLDALVLREGTVMALLHAVSII